MGDFNEIMFSFEKQEERIREGRQMATFRETLEDCQLNDIGFSGQWFTWERGKLEENNIRERLDRGLATLNWWTCFPDYTLQPLVHGFSDHCPLMLNTLGR